MLWELDIPIDLWLLQECECVCVLVCPHDALPLILFEHPSVANHRGMNSVEFCVIVTPPGDNMNYNTFAAYKHTLREYEYWEM